MSEDYLEKAVESAGDTDDEPGKDRQFVTALARGLEVLRCFRPGEQFLGNREIAKRTGLPKPTVSRLTYTLTQLGYLNYSETLGKYFLGTGVLSFGNTFLSNMNIRQVARPLMQELADYTHASIALGARDRLDMVYIENCRSSATAFTVNLDVGSRVPVATTAMGRAYLCGLPERQRDHLLDQIRKQDEERWPQIRSHIEQALKDYQEKGFCLSVGDWQKDVNAVGVPFVPVNGSDVLSFNCGGPAFHIRRHMLEDDIGPRLVALVRNIHATLSRQ